MKTVGIKCPFCGGAVEFGEGEKTATEQKKTRKTDRKRMSPALFFFERFRFCAHARSRTRPYENEPDFPRKRRERAHTGTDRADAAVKQTERCRKRYERFTFCGRNAFFSGNLFFSQLRVSASVLRKERGR